VRKRIAIYYAGDEALRLIPMLLGNPTIEISAIFDPNPAAVRDNAANFDPAVLRTLDAAFTDDASAIARDPALHAVVDGGPKPGYAARFPAVAGRGVQIVSPLTARLLWGYDSHRGDHKAELLLALQEVVESVDFNIDPDELFTRMLEIALHVTGADDGSLMLCDEEAGELRVRVASGIPRVEWPSIRVPFGEGIAGRVAGEARPLRIRGRADRRRFRITRERDDIESALSVPLVHSGHVLGVLNLHHRTSPDVFTDEDFRFIQKLARLNVQIITRAQEHEILHKQLARHDAIRRIRAVFGAGSTLSERLDRFCALVAEWTGGDLVTLYLLEPDGDAMRLSATSRDGNTAGSEVRVSRTEGIAGAVVQTRVPVYLRSPEGALAYVVQPLIADGRLAGLLSLQLGERATQQPGIEATLVEIAAVVAEEIAHAEREASIATRAAKLEAINESSLRMNASEDLAAVVRLATSLAASVLEADHAILRLQDDESGHLVIRSYLGAADNSLKAQLFRLDRRLAADAIRARTSLLSGDLRDDPNQPELRAPARSAIAAPLLRDGQVIGSLAIYDHVAADRFEVGCFDDTDLELFRRFHAAVEQAVAGAIFHAEAREQQGFDAETRLANADSFASRIHEEIVRATAGGDTLALVVCRIENLDAIEDASGRVAGRRVARRTAEALRAHLREFDLPCRLARGEFGVLLPEPGEDPLARLIALARAVADDVSKDDALNEPVRVDMAFGYALFPDDGRTRETLVAHARIARIQMV
jgi:diguanylate cyclase (GGDEF)-like protein